MGTDTVRGGGATDAEPYDPTQMSSALKALLRKTAETKADDFKLTPVPQEVLNELKKFLFTKYGGFVTRDTVMVNGHLITMDNPP